jgi:hypothetical protein
MAMRHERLMQIRQTGNYRATRSSATHHQHAHLPFEQLRVDAVNFHDQLLNARFRERRILVAFRRHRSGN